MDGRTLPVTAATEALRTQILRFGSRARAFGFAEYQEAMAELEASSRCRGDDEDEEAFEIARMNAAIAAVLYHARLVLDLTDDLDALEAVALVPRLSALALGTPSPVQLRFVGVPELASVSAAIHEVLRALRAASAPRVPRTTGRIVAIA